MHKVVALLAVVFIPLLIDLTVFRKLVVKACKSVQFQLCLKVQFTALTIK